jgi:hypothetical protein
MAGDITRSTFDPKKGYTSVRMQQGRLQLDADWNEQADIQNHLRRAYVTDMIGSGSGASKVDPITGKPSETNFQLWLISTQPLPSGQGQDSGTAADPTAATDIAAAAETTPVIEPNSTTTIDPSASGSGTKSPATQAPPITDLVLLPGHFYINGILCESTPGSPFMVKSVAAKDVSVTTLQVIDSLTIDGQRLKKGDWLIRDKSPANNANSDDKNKPVYQEGWRIRDIDVKTRILTVNGPPMGTDETLRRVITYSTQPDLPEAPPLEAGTYLAYLDVWERQLSAIDDPTLREVALNVPDTTTRTKTVWQVKLQPLAPVTDESPEDVTALTQPVNSPAWSPESVSQQWAEFQNQNQFRDEYRGLAPLLNACARLCTGTSTNGITANRLGNFLYRVEVHQGNDGDADPFGKRSTVTFKWSRTNGSVVSPIKKLEGDVIRIAKASQDVWADSQPGQWLELLTLAQELKGEPGILVPLVRVSDTKIEFDPARIIGGAIPDNVTKVRRWDHTVDKAPQGAIPIQSEWIELESGIKVQFYPNRTYRTGDYWLIPSRTATNDIEWPSDRADEDVTLADNQGASVSQPLPQPPNGIEHQYALLAIVEVADVKDKDQKQQITQVIDQRVLFPPLQRTLDTSGGDIKGSLNITNNLTVGGTANIKDLEFQGEFTANRVKAEAFEIRKNPTSNDAESFGSIQTGAGDNNQAIGFIAKKPETSFVFLGGKVGIEQAEPIYTLDINGSLKLENGVHINEFSNDQTLGNDGQGSEDTVPTQMAVKTYVRNQLDAKADLNGSGQENFNVNTLTCIQFILDGSPTVSGISTAIDSTSTDNTIPTQNAVKVYVDSQATTLNNLISQKANSVGDPEEDFSAKTLNCNQLQFGTAIDKITGLKMGGPFNNDNALLPTEGAVKSYVESAISGVESVMNQKASLNGDLTEDFSANQIFAQRLATGMIDGNEVLVRTQINSSNYYQLSSKEFKQDFGELSRQHVAKTLGQLNPVTFRYKHDKNSNICAGFIAEEMPDWLTSSDHQSIKIMDLVAVLTKAVQDNRKVINQLSNQVSQQAKEINQLKQALAQDSSQV